LIEGPSEKEKEEDEREYVEDEVTVFIKRFNKFIKKRRPYKGECATIVTKIDILLSNVHERKEEDNEKKEA
jgi:hypothetical protein